MKFEETKMYKKGQLGEEIVDRFIIQRGKFIPYAPMVDDEPHTFDRLLATKDKKRLMIVEVKTLDSRDYYPDTGISIAHYEEYIEIQNKYGIDVWIFFVDSKLKKIYGNTLNNLNNEVTITHRGRTITYPDVKSNFTAVGGNIIYFPLMHMIDIAELTKDQAEQIKRYSNKGYKEGVSWKKGYKEWQNSRKVYQQR